MCAKHEFGSFTEAQKVAKKQYRNNTLRGRTARLAAPYHCYHCGGIHLTSHANPRSY